ncbi:hypothetical protein M6D81_04240 [Paenibacillus sp. J5C_2022]|uniref:hypothetical protein n=1 Tax=Paenibacillus sp. J5C2022 TaxID=2977129 RepID=UPI0021D25440|nr:hypothetical protein [Paenibacillus sp. J5C2022]MCU6707914.1 hypothetical protein [Paenibacillus sp. J5C2022]
MTDHNVALTKLSQWEALMLESLKAHGWSGDELIRRVQEGDLPADDSKFKFDYSSLTELAKEQPELFLAAALDGYRIKYNTIRGISSWIEVALKQEAELTLDPGKESVTAALTAEEYTRLAEVLSVGWSIAEAGPGAEPLRPLYRVQLAG